MQFLIFFLISTAFAQGPKIYDCFLFFNELEILQIRLEELYDHVDHFVLVESVESFRGKEKPLFFLEHAHLFEKYRDKLIYVPLSERQETDSPWNREHYQRRQMIRGLTHCQDEDIILISDVDEIIDSRRLPKIIEDFTKTQALFAFCVQKMYRYFINRWDVPNSRWPGTAITTFKFLKNSGTDAIRGQRTDRASLLIEDAGWHFTSCGGPQRFIEKIESWSHHEYDRKENKELAKIRRDSSGQFLVPIDETFPRFVRENQEYLKERGLIDSSTDIPLGQLRQSWPQYEQYANLSTEPPPSAPSLPYDTSGWCNPALLKFLETYTKENRIDAIADTHVWLGLSTQCLALLLPERGKVYAFDQWPNPDSSDPRAPYAYESFLSNMRWAKVARKVVPLTTMPDFLQVGIVHIGPAKNLYEEILSWAKVAPKALFCGSHENKEKVQAATLQLGRSFVDYGSFWVSF